MADEEGLRKEAVRRHHGGEDAASIARDLGHSERWVFKWVSRYETGEQGWFASESRRPDHSPSAVEPEIVRLVLKARDRLEADPRAQRGSTAIAWELSCLEVPDQRLPQPWTIERIIKREGRSKPRLREPNRYKPKGTPYPVRACLAVPGALHEIDPVGPRYLEGAQEVHSLNVMDVGSHRVALEPLARPTPRAYAEHLVAAWRRLGLPEIAQLDNHPSLRGDIGRSRVFGPVPKTCLDLGVKLRYIPLKEPWRNGAIEHFQDTFDKSFFRTQRFTDLGHLSERSRDFEVFHNSRHRYSPLKGKAPDEAWGEAKMTPRFPPPDFEIPGLLPQKGQIEVLRLIRSDRLLNLWGEKIELPAATVHQYVIAAIDVRAQQLVVTHSGEVVYEADYAIR